MAKFNFNPFFIPIFVSFSLHYYTCLSQPTAPAPSAGDCNGVFISYNYTGGRIIHPFQPGNQPYRFESTLSVLNNGLDDLKDWRVFLGFQNDEVLVSASNAVLANGDTLPAQVGHGAVLAGFPATDLKSAIETAGDLTQMEVRVQLVGTQFRVPNASLPDNLTLANDGYSCPLEPTRPEGTNELRMCCQKDLNFKSNITVGDQFSRRQGGDLVIMYDVTRMYETNYLAQVTVSNHNPLGRVDNWRLSWEWMRQEFIFSMKGAYPELVDTTDCVFGPQGQFYKELDFAQALTCDKRPTIQDLPPTMANDSDRGKIPFCCRNGTLLSPTVDPQKSTSAFQMQVFKMPPDVNRTEVLPPQNWWISGTEMNSDYQCGSPIRVSPTQFPDPSGLPSFSSAFASWQVVCNKTQSKTPKCCVSFSAFFNDSVVPCKTCACGCNGNKQSNTCSANTPALLERPQDLFVPFENRTDKTQEWARLQRREIPDRMPCGDNCGVSVHWHLVSDSEDGWAARITLFNWGDVNFADWFAAVQLDKAVPGFEAAYSFNGTALPGSDNDINNTILMYGLEGLNFLLAEKDGDNPRKDPRVPGLQQSVISFKKKPTPGINVAAGDGFPSKVFFNGEECSLPEMLPSLGHKISAIMTSLLGLVIAMASLAMQ